MSLIGISGYSGSGKDAIGTIIQYLNCPNVSNTTIEEAIRDYSDNQWWLEENSGWEIKKWAGKLKDIASHLTGIPVEDFEDQEFKKTNLGPEWSKTEPYNSDAPWIGEGETIEVPMTVREFLQKLGTDALRMGLHDNVWVNALMADYIPDEDGDLPSWVITDTRFPNEAKAIKEKGGIIIRVERPGVKPINDHPSEVGLDNWKFDYRIVNNSDLFALKFNVLEVLKHANIKA